MSRNLLVEFCCVGVLRRVLGSCLVLCRSSLVPLIIVTVVAVTVNVNVNVVIVVVVVLARLSCVSRYSFGLCAGVTPNRVCTCLSRKIMN